MKRSINSVLLIATLLGVTANDTVQGAVGCDAPSISFSPSGATQAPGSALTLAVEAGGTEPFRYLWRKNGNALEQATNRTLILTPLFFEDAGTYAVIVSNSCGSATSAPVVVRVEDTTRPILTCVPDKTGPCNGLWGFGQPVASDECVFDALAFDNSVNDLLLRFNPGAFEVGDEIILDGAARRVSTFVFEYWGRNALQAGFEGIVQARVRFYANDGSFFAGYATPGTLIYDSGPFPVEPTARATLIIEDFASDAALPLVGEVPDRFTWTVQFSGLGAGDLAGLDLYSPIVVGQGFSDYWERTPSGWVMKTNANAAVNFAARLEATYGEVTVAVINTVTNMVSDGTMRVTRTWAASDPSGNTTDCSQTVIVLAPVRARVSSPASQNVLLPSVAQQTADPIVIGVKDAFPISFMRAELSHVPDGYSIVNGTYTAWDVDYWKYIYPGLTYEAILYDTTQSLPLALQNEAWDKVNYILNHKLGNSDDIQVAIWHYAGGPVATNDPDYYPPSGTTLQMIAEAETYGEGFIPGPGGVSAVVVDYLEPGIARSLIEVRRTETISGCEGEALNICVEASGSAPITYSWYQDGALLVSASGPCLNFSSLAVADAGQYRVEIVGACGVVTNNISLEVLPGLVANPLSSLSRLLGQSATFSTTATGTGPFTYVWRHNGTLLSGQTSNSLTIPSVTAGDVGTYSVEVSGHCRSVTNNATLTLSSPPTFNRPVRQSNGIVQFTIYGGVGMNCVIQASTNLTTWFEVANLPNINGTITWTDPNAAQYPRRFYRALLEP